MLLTATPATSASSAVTTAASSAPQLGLGSARNATNRSLSPSYCRRRWPRWPSSSRPSPTLQFRPSSTEAPTSRRPIGRLLEVGKSVSRSGQIQVSGTNFGGCGRMAVTAAPTGIACHPSDTLPPGQPERWPERWQARRAGPERRQGCTP